MQNSRLEKALPPIEKQQKIGRLNDGPRDRQGRYRHNEPGSAEHVYGGRFSKHCRAGPEKLNADTNGTMKNVKRDDM